MNVLRRLRQLVAEGKSATLVTILRVRGSSPRGVGSCMVVTDSASYGSIGGGNLEYRSIERARQLQGGSTVEKHAVTLGPELNQCCGGVVDVLFETFDRPAQTDWIDNMFAGAAESGFMLTTFDCARSSVTRSYPGSRDDLSWNAREAIDTAGGVLPLLMERDDSWTIVERPGNGALDLVLFGAGHVGKALVNVLSPCDVNLTWVDSRSAEFPETLSPNVRTVVADDNYENARETIACAGPATAFLVMTHSHPIDYGLCRAVLEKGRFSYLGLIGSQTKRARFRSHLLKDGISTSLLDRLTCPIGVPGLDGKLPGEIAVSVAAELLGLSSGGVTESASAIASDGASNG